MVATLGTLLILAWYMNFMSQSKLENIGTLTEVAAQMPTGSPWTAVNGTTLESVIAPSGIGVTSNKARNLGFTVICPARGVPGAGAVPADTLKNTAPVTGGRSITPGAQAATGKMSSADPGYYSQCTGTLGNYRLTYRAGNTDAQWIAVLKTLGTDTPATSQ
jgi:hypothetical protein